MTKYITCLLACLLSIKGLAQYDNPANRYVDAYKQYLTASCPLEQDEIQHFVYVARDREAIKGHPLLTTARIAGAQIMYSWRQLEPQRGTYDFSLIWEDHNYLQAHGKKLFIQLQDVTFHPDYKAIPKYLTTEEFDGGCIQSLTDDGVADGWVAKRWNAKLQQRLALLLGALGKEFDGKIEGINLQESAVGVRQEQDPSFSPERYAACLKENMLALKKAFPISTTMQYANFMPGEWLPWEDKGHLRSLYQYGQKIGVGLGGPDLMVKRKGQLNHLIAMMHEGSYTVPLGIAIQDGNYIGKTGADRDYDEQSDAGARRHQSIVPLLHAFAKDFLRVDYLFWAHQEPHLSQQLLPCLAE